MGGRNRACSRQTSAAVTGTIAHVIQRSASGQRAPSTPSRVDTTSRAVGGYWNPLRRTCG
jgi:hypothetical protein